MSDTLRGTIIYACPDNPNPSGGVRRIYRHVEILTDNGLSACVLHSQLGFRVPSLSTQVPVLYRTAAFGFCSGDTLVIPEVMPGLMQETSDLSLARVVIALNWGLIYKYLPIGIDWRTYNIHRVIAGGQYDQTFIRETMDLESVVIASGTDPYLFCPHYEKLLRIAYMPRKHSLAPAILGAFRARYPEYSDVELVSIANKSHSEVAEILARTAIFLCATFPEGLARPPLEAMASGCVVVGFTGRGSGEYMHHGINCYVAEDGDVLGAVRYLAKAVSDWSGSGATNMQRAARSTAMQYDLKTEESAVLKYWRSFY